MGETIHSVPTIFYPTSDGQPMAETEIHRDLMIDFIQMLKAHFEDVQDVCISGNLFMYYEEGNTKKSIAPDVFVVFGVAKKLRNTYLVWEEGRTPDFVLEVASPGTYPNDIGRKKELYASVLAVKEYYIYDPMGQIVPSFVGYELTDGVYQEIEFENDRLQSKVLGLELGEYEGELGLFDPIKSEWLEPLPEVAKKAQDLAEMEANARYNAERHAEDVERRAKDAERRAKEVERRAEDAERLVKNEATARKVAEERANNAESELAQALAELEGLRANKKK